MINLHSLFFRMSYCIIYLDLFLYFNKTHPAISSNSKPFMITESWYFNSYLGSSLKENFLLYINIIKYYINIIKIYFKLLEVIFIFKTNFRSKLLLFINESFICTKFDICNVIIEKQEYFLALSK